MKLNKFELEAGIACLYCIAPTYMETDWIGFRKIYDVLFRIEPTPIVALNRAIAIGQADGPKAGLVALEEVDSGSLKNYPLLFATLGELHHLAGDQIEERKNWQMALDLTTNPTEEKLLREKLREST